VQPAGDVDDRAGRERETPGQPGFGIVADPAVPGAISPEGQVVRIPLVLDEGTPAPDDQVRAPLPAFRRGATEKRTAVAIFVRLLAIRNGPRRQSEQVKRQAIQSCRAPVQRNAQRRGGAVIDGT
jgi:hypothetical protein